MLYIVKKNPVQSKDFKFHLKTFVKKSNNLQNLYGPAQKKIVKTPLPGPETNSR